MADKKNQIEVGDGESPNPDSEKQEVSAWLRSINKTEKVRDDAGKKAGWKRFIDEYKNEWGWLKNEVSIPIIPINLIYAYTKTEIARLYFKDPWITVNPKRTEDIGAAQIAEQVINYEWSELSLKQEIKKALLEAILVGHAYVKVGYSAEFGTVESQPNSAAKRGPGRPKKVSEIETSEYIKSENVFAYHVPYKDIIFDSSANFPATHNARWMAHRIEKPKRAVVESGIYQNTEFLKSSSRVSEDGAGFDTASNESSEQLSKDIDTVTLWEVYDLDHMQVLTVSPGCPYFLNKIDYPEYLSGGFPFSMLAFNPVPGEVYPLSDVAAQEGLSIEMTKIVAIWINHLKRHNRQIIVAPDFLTPSEKAKFADGIDGAIIEGQVPAGGNLANGYFVPQYPPVQADSYQIYNEAYRLYQVVSGQTPADQGGPTKAPTRTLGELRLQMMGGHARADEKVDVLEDFIAEIARKLLGIMQKKYDLPKIARIVGPSAIQRKMGGALQGRPSAQQELMGGGPNPVAQQSFTSDFSFSWNRQDILGQMDVDVVAGSTVPMDKESNLRIMQEAIPFLPAAGITPGSPAAKQYAREMFRLIGNQSLESIMDLVDETPPQNQPNPEMMTAMANAQIKQQESQVKVQSKMAEEKIKLQALQQKLELDKQKMEMDIKKNVLNTILQSVRGAQGPTNGQENGNGL